MSYRDEQLALKPPFVIDQGYAYRDFSGTYACPHCHWKFEQNIRLRPGDTHCNGCGAELIWLLKKEPCQCWASPNGWHCNCVEDGPDYICCYCDNEQEPEMVVGITRCGRTDYYGGVGRVYSDGIYMVLTFRANMDMIRFRIADGIELSFL